MPRTCRIPDSSLNVSICTNISFKLNFLSLWHCFLQILQGLHFLKSFVKCEGELVEQSGRHLSNFLTFLNQNSSDFKVIMASTVHSIQNLGSSYGYISATFLNVLRSELSEVIHQKPEKSQNFQLKFFTARAQIQLVCYFFKKLDTPTYL